MLKIRREQYEILKESFREQYVPRQRRRFRRDWTEECAELDDDGLDALLRAARDRAELYGLEIEGDVVTFTETWLLLGDDFDTNPDYPWAPRILRDDQMNGTAKASALRHWTDKVLGEIAGEGSAS
ncbi:MAG: hypothetical protein RL885_19130 [Planctomycetota bacterium]